jgi:uncharacterized phiE125 gp8 family phage protein
VYPSYSGVNLCAHLRYGSVAGHGSISLTETSPIQSFDEPISLDEIKSYLRVPTRSPVDDDEDGELAALITAAREQAEILQGRDLVRKQWDLSFDYWPPCEIELRDPLVSVDLVQYRNSSGVYTTLAEMSITLWTRQNVPASSRRCTTPHGRRSRPGHHPRS